MQLQNLHQLFLKEFQTIIRKEMGGI